MRIVIAGGGTAGHIVPSIAVADRLREGGASVEFVGSPDGPEASLVPAAGYRFHAVAAAPFRREISVRSAAAPFVALRSVATSRPIVRDAAAVLGMGGYASIAPVLAARSVRVPTILHEQNAIPGLANRLLARLVTAMALTFEDSRGRLPRSLRVEVTGLPLRRDIREVSARREELAAEARRMWSLEPERTTVLVTGGSQGALHIDQTVAGAIPLLASRSDLQLIVLTGPAHDQVVATAINDGMPLIVRTVPFLDRMELALAVADLAVARAGASTIHELAACSIPSILVPYPHATDDHQEANARELERAGAADLYRDRDLTPEGLARRILALVADRERRTVMAKEGAAWAKPDADERVAELVRDVVAPTRSGADEGALMNRTPLYRPPSGSIPTLGVPSLEGVTKVHLIGVGGAGMRNLARLFLARGIAVSGSDLKDSEGLRELAALGARVRVGHDASELDDPDAVVISSAIAEGNPELSAARGRGLAVWARQQAIAAFADAHRSIAVAGTTGKTTTTSMIAAVLEHGCLDPTFLIGGDLNESGSGARAGGGDLFLFEADESDGSFLLTDPAVGVVTNVELDHVDFYPGGEEELRLAFAEFCARSGRLIVCTDDEGARESLRIAGVDAIGYGTEPGTEVRLTIETPGPGGARGTLAIDGALVSLELRIDGAHNLLDAAAAVAVGVVVGLPADEAAHALASFEGVRRRFEHRGNARGADFFDDYAHVPHELAVTLGVARARGPRRLVAVFQPHRYSRTQALWRELGSSLVGADLIVVTDVYGANQTPIPGVTGALVVDGVRRAAPEREVVYAPHGEDAISFLTGEVREGDLVITLGCGDVWMLGDAALARIGEADGDG